MPLPAFKRCDTDGFERFIHVKCLHILWNLKYTKCLNNATPANHCSKWNLNWTMLSSGSINIKTWMLLENGPCYFITRKHFDGHSGLFSQWMAAYKKNVSQKHGNGAAHIWLYYAKKLIMLTFGKSEIYLWIWYNRVYQNIWKFKTSNISQRMYMFM